jgi:hypothetical protein
MEEKHQSETMKENCQRIFEEKYKECFGLLQRKQRQQREEEKRLQDQRAKIRLQLPQQLQDLEEEDRR